MLKGLSSLARSILNSFSDLAPIFLVVAFFQLVVLQQPIPNLLQLLGGGLLVVLGLSFFTEVSLFF